MVDEDYKRARQILRQWEVAEAYTLILKRELDSLNKQWMNEDSEDFKILQGRAKQLTELLLIVAPSPKEKQQEREEMNG